MMAGVSEESAGGGRLKAKSPEFTIPPEVE